MARRNGLEERCQCSAPTGGRSGVGGVGSRKGLGKRGPRGAVRQEFLLLGVGSKAVAGGSGDDSGSRGAKRWLVHVLAHPGQGYVRRALWHRALARGEDTPPSGSFRERGWAAAEGRAVRRASPGR